MHPRNPEPGPFGLNCRPTRAQSLTHAEVNDAKIAIKRPLDGAIELTGTGDNRNPLRWSLRVVAPSPMHSPRW